MNRIIKEILTLPGVIGTCVLNKKQQVLLTELPETFTEAMAVKVASNIGRMAQMAQVKGLEPQTISINYDTFIVVVLTLENDTLLIALCKPACNTSLVTTTASMLGSELVATLQQDQKTKIEQNSPETAPQPEESAGTEIPPKTSKALEYLKKSLFETIGPIAEMVYGECYDRWTNNNAADIDRIFELVGYISTEIDNPDLFNEFKTKIASLL